MPNDFHTASPTYSPSGLADELDAAWRKAIRVMESTEAEWAPLHARFGPGGQWDAHRRAYRGALAIEIRQQMRDDGVAKPTEAMVEDAACADPRYLAYLTESEREGARYAVLTSQRARAKETLEWCRTRAYLAGAEARLAPQGGGL